MKPEFVLVCKHIQCDIEHPNEYLSATTLRSLQHLPREIVELIIDCVPGRLTSKFSFVRAAAIVAMHAVYRQYPDVLSAGPEIVADHLTSDTSSVVRIGLRMLSSFAPRRALAFLSTPPVFHS